VSISVVRLAGKVSFLSVKKEAPNVV